MFQHLKFCKNSIHDWVAKEEEGKELPLYSSVDIRESGFKASVVDTNLFPAGFNNLCSHGIEDGSFFIREEIFKKVPDCRNVLVISEEHTRNTWYLENVRILAQMIEGAGFNVRVGTFNLSDISSENRVLLKTALDQDIEVFNLSALLEENSPFYFEPHIAILNNDLTQGIPGVLKEISIPIYPSVQAGWHSRSKIHHFDHYNELIQDFCRDLAIDPWLLSCYHRPTGVIDIFDEAHREELCDLASDLMKDIQKKYDEYGIKEKPFFFLKADSGTYGMGVMSFNEPSDIIQLNRKKKNKLHKGKNSKVISRFLLQEGIPSSRRVKEHVSEVCFYQVGNHPIGGFYRIHRNKDSRDSLNSKGMDFQTFCSRTPRLPDCGQHQETEQLCLYRFLARVAGLAAQREIVHLEMAVS